MEKVMITNMKDRLIKNLSKGYKQRVGIAQTLIGNPDIIILDEPTVGLDPKQIIEIRTLIKQLGEDHTVLISSHILSEIGAVCDHVVIINKGHLVVSDSTENLEKLFKGQDTERDMDELWEVNAQAVRNAIEKSNIDPKDIAGVSFSGHGKGLYMVGYDGKPSYAESHPDFLMKNRCVWWPEPGVSTSIFRKNL